MKNLKKLLTGTALATALAFNSYSQNLKNTLVAYVSIKDEKKETIFNIDSLKSYDISFTIEKVNMFDLLMKGMKVKPNKEKSDTKIKLYLIRKTEKETRIIPAITEGGYDFSKDSKKTIEKQVREFLKDEKISISDAVEYGSGEMFMEIVGND
ncbi:MAG: hypothetical protein AABY06_00270 [Nanoarchaeota archaeon]